MTTAGLRFCKHCGGELTITNTFDRADAPRGAEGVGGGIRKLAALFWAVAIFGLVPLVVLFGISIPLTALHASKDVVVPLYIFGPTAIVVIAAMMIRQISRLIRLLERESEARPMGVSLPEATQHPQIAAPPPSFRSVTEHTTRNFEPRAYREQERSQ
jgi:hypothetical protein